MALSEDYKRGYSKGYNAGSRGSWPIHRPPSPPDEIVSAMLSAVRDLRDEVDNELAKFPQNDEIVELLGPKVDAVDEQFVRIGEWLRNRAAE